ncbi:MAG: S9 family peptidase [Aquisalinus sp.]|nr:S9 family peptidase [Aquisalinus sp.]
MSSHQSAEVPEAKKVDTEIIQHGQKRLDPYSWMKDENWQQVLREPDHLREDIRQHLEREAKYYEALTAGLEPLRQTLVREMRGRIQEEDSTVPVPDGPYAYYSRFREGGNYRVFCRMPRDGGEETILYDGDDEAGDSEFFSVGSVVTSPDHNFLICSTDRVGSEYYNIQVRDLTTGSDIGTPIKNTSGEAVWASDSKSFFYIERDASQRPKRVRHHVIGDNPDADRIVYEEADDGMFLSIGKTTSGKFIIIHIGDQVTTESWFIPANEPFSDPVIFAPRIIQQEYYVDHVEDWFFIRTNQGGAIDFKIVRASVVNPSRENWQTVIPHREGTLISEFTTFKEYLVRAERKDARPCIVVSDYEGNESEIDFEEAAYSVWYEDGREYETDILRFHYESMSRSTEIIDYNMRTGRRELRKQRSIPSGHNPELYIVERLDAIASDGAKVPVVVLRLKDTALDGSAPLLLYGYGSYGAYIDDGFSSNILSLVDRGVVYALAHIRGGSAKGQRWYLDGKLGKKMNSFTDFIAAAELLIDNGYTSKGRIVSYGGSAGGLLVGASVNLRPDLFGGVLAAVPFVDVLNTISDDTLPLTPPEWPEWGDPIHDIEGYNWISQYSPYDNIKAGEVYPPILATGGLTDYRVTYWEMAKWIARMRDETTGGPFLLRMNMKAGHGGSAARFEQLEERAHLFAFALDLWGLRDKQPVKHH